MTTITIDRKLLEEIVELFDYAISTRYPHEILRDIRAALAAPAIAPDAMTRAILEQALEVLEGIHRLDEYPEIQPAIDAIRALKEQQ